MKLHKVIDKAHELRAVCILAHLFRGWESFGKNVLNAEGIDALENHNGVNNSEQNALAAKPCMQLGLPSTGGSDRH